MYIEFHDKLGKLCRADVTRVVVYDVLDNPVAFAVEHDTRTVFAYTAEHGEFNAMLRNLGINRVVRVQGLPQQPLGDVRFG